MREYVHLSVDHAQTIAQPVGRVLEFVTRIHPDAPPLQAMLVGEWGQGAQLLVYFPGFNTPMGPWEAAKCRMLAHSFGQPVLVVEIPGMSHYGDALPGRVRKQMMNGDVGGWAELLVDYQLAALQALGLEVPTTVDLLGYSTGCSLGVAAFEGWSEHARVRSVSMVEPVATLSRNLLQLELHNVADVLRQPASYKTNHRHDWVMRARRRQLREPWVRYGPVDLVAIAQVLAQPQLPAGLPLDGSVIVNLVRGTRSDLCDAESFAGLHRSAPSNGVTVDVVGLGHPLGHSFPVLEQLVPLVGAAVRNAAQQN